MVNRAKAVNSERVVLVGPDIASDDGGTMSAVFAAAAVAAVIAGNTDPVRAYQRRGADAFRRGGQETE